MSDNVSGLLNGFLQSSQSLEKVSESILSLQEVMGKFQEAADNFTIKNEMDTLLPKVNEHMSQVSEMYAGIQENLQKIEGSTEHVQSSGRECFTHIESSLQQLDGVREYLQQYLEEIIPFYKELEPKMAVAQELQQSTKQGMQDVQQVLQKVASMHQEVTTAISEQQQLLHKTVAEQQNIAQSFTELQEVSKTYATEVTETVAELKMIRASLQQHTEELLPAYKKMQSEVQVLKEMDSGMRGFSAEISENIIKMTTLQKELKNQLLESQEMQADLLEVAHKTLAMNAFITKMEATDVSATEYFSQICDQWSKDHLDEVITAWADKNLEGAIKKQIKKALKPW